MAFLDSNVQSQTQDQSSQGQAAGGAPDAPNVSGAGGSDVGGVSTAGVGNGGTGGWTNIQAYLNANKGDTGSAQNLNNTVGAQFQNEQNQMKGQADQTLQGSKNYLDSTNVSNDQANAWVNQAANAYSWNAPTAGNGKGGTINAPKTGAGMFAGSPEQKVTAPGTDYTVPKSGNKSEYQSVVDQAGNAMNGQWGGPTNFAYGLSDKSQNYGNTLNDNNGFKNLMSNMYSQQANAPLTSGQFELQNQLDTNNQALNQARYGLQGQYQGLQNQAGQISQDTTNALTNDQNQFHANQNRLKSYFGDQANTYAGNISKEDQDARASFDNAYNTQDLGLRGDGYFGDGTAANLENMKQNAIYRQWAGGDHSGPLAGMSPFFQQVDPTLNNFYDSQNQKYANVDDQDKRSWNSIQDFLGSGDNRQTQGFRVK